MQAKSQIKQIQQHHHPKVQRETLHLGRKEVGVDRLVKKQLACDEKP
ncbi:unnamed protein product [marine sediment metagenome]|uniref:Uncharacterized protein n=1 Tax=marine sediment metagenome TaxID=412755 RepID=X0RLD6_9ZZZZ